MRARIIGWTVKLLFLGLFILAFIETRYALPVCFQNIFFRFDPLILIVVSIALRAIASASLVALVVVAATLVFGRFFCGFVCPLGTALDAGGLFVRPRRERASRWRAVKDLILLFLIATAALGASFLHLFDPLVILERSLTLVAQPVATFLAGVLQRGTPVVYTEGPLALGVLVLIFGLNRVSPRFWCRNLCPLGGLLALCSRFSFFKFTFTCTCGDSCTKCGRCEDVCPTDAIAVEAARVDAAECIACLQCVHECPPHVIQYRFALAPSRAAADPSRRQVLGALAASVIAAPLARTLLHARLSDRLIRPPGSIPEGDFLNACVRCGKCLKVCPTNGLQPCVLDAGIDGLWTPRLAARIGGCEKNCSMCGQVCPTGAIRRLDPEEKTYARMGTAVIDRARCIAWEQDRICLICDEACPYDAIGSLSETVRGVTLPRPFVDEAICTGCGLCEARCPIEGRAAIEVFPIGEERTRTGSYITEEKVRQRACAAREETLPAGLITDD